MATKNSIGKMREDGVGFAVFIKATGDFAVLIAAEKERWIFTCFFATIIEVCDDFGGTLEKLWTFDAGLSDGDFAMRAT